ncbi:MAG: DUF4097 family beta strand repeat protein [Clostridia bacterium]|nr:DUF4097 family beta strand repeat protein [Clostridia bacterium]
MKIALTVSVICLAVGLVGLTLAFALSGFNIFNFNSMEFHTNSYTVSETFSKIHVSDIECDIRLFPSDDESTRIEAKENDKIYYTIQAENEILEIKRHDKRAWYEHIGFFFNQDMVLKLYLPKSAYELLTLETVSGNIEVPDSFTFTSITLKTTSGEITSECTVNNGATVAVTSGNIRICNVLDGKISVGSVSGNITLTNSQGTHLRLSATSGNIKLQNVIATGDINAETVSGGIELDRVDGAKLSAKTTSGNVTCKLLSPKNYSVSTTSGSTHYPASDESAGICEVSTVSGNINIELYS